MPSTEQIIINLRTLLANDALKKDNRELSKSGQQLVNYMRQWLQQFMDLIQHKNEEDQIQDLIWYLSKSWVAIDTDHLAHRARQSRARADTAAAYQSLRTVGSLLLTNSDFRMFLNDLNVVGREVFRDSAFTLSSVADEAGRKIDPSEAEKQAVAKPGSDGDMQPPDARDLKRNLAEAGEIVANGSAQVAKTAVESAEDKLSGDEGKTMLNRLKQAVAKLRQRDDYSDSVSTLSLLIQRYAMVYSRAALEIQDAAVEDTDHNPALDRAVRNAWLLLTSFGDKKEWEKVKQCWDQVMSHKDSDPQFEEMMKEVGTSLQNMLTDPAFFDHAQEHVQELKAKIQGSKKESDLLNDIQSLLKQLEEAFKAVLNDEDIRNLITTTSKIFDIISPLDRSTNADLIQDAMNVFVPTLIAAVQYIPIPRLEISTPKLDLLLENLIFEPGHTVNRTSFLPYRFKVETYNDFEIRAAHASRTATSIKSLMTIKLDGFSIRAEEIGFWLRAHSGLLHVADEGIASFALDEKGIDIHVDVEFCRERLEQILTLKAVRVHIHKFTYKVRKTKLAWLGWLFKPVLRPLLRKIMEKQLASALANFFHAANRELVFARERLRATRISNPNDLMTFIRAVMARLQPAEDPDLYTRVGVRPPRRGRVRDNVFSGVYAPGSIVKIWDEEARQARERVEEHEDGGWRNEIFDTHVTDLSHLASVLILIHKMRSSSSASGISFKSQFLYLIVYVSRYLGMIMCTVNKNGFAAQIRSIAEHLPATDLFWTDPTKSLWNTIFKIVFISSQAYIIYLMLVDFKPTHDPNQDTFKVEYLLGGAAVLGIVLPPVYRISEMLWAFSIWLESVAILPQLFMLQRTGEAETITTHYLFALGAYRALYIPNWIYRHFVGQYVELIAVVAGVVQTVLYSDFFYIYWTKVLQGKKFNLPV
ncbi:MAG: hypothetical protein FE78DRAFT_32396 [Acidomyces sp. 'richmondensis']|nr:MAG: hypothetical protein FE78DRAFT_32396 [Acidomyces sp. 'richmondensis']